MREINRSFSNPWQGLITGNFMSGVTCMLIAGIRLYKNEEFSFQYCIHIIKFNLINGFALGAIIFLLPSFMPRHYQEKANYVAFFFTAVICSYAVAIQMSPVAVRAGVNYLMTSIKPIFQNNEISLYETVKNVFNR